MPLALFLELKVNMAWTLNVFFSFSYTMRPMRSRVDGKCSKCSLWLPNLNKREREISKRFVLKGSEKKRQWLVDEKDKNST